MKGIRRFLLRADMLESVRRYDARLTHAVQVCQVRFKMVVLKIRGTKSDFMIGPDGAW